MPCKIHLHRIALGHLLYALFALPVWAADPTPPTVPVVTDEGVYTTSNTTLNASWAASDPESGLAEYQYSVRQDSPTGPLIRDWTSTGTTPAVAATGFVTGSGKTKVNGLANGRNYYVAVKARNAEGLWSAQGLSDGIEVDTTPPTIPVINVPSPTTTSHTTLSASWSSSDPESGIAEYQYAIGTYYGWFNIVPWTSVGTATSVTRSDLTLREGLSYYLSVKSRNAAGQWSQWSEVQSSVGVLIIPPPQGNLQMPWRLNMTGMMSFQQWGMTVGYQFTPLVNGQITELAALFNSGTREVRLYETATGTLRASAAVTSTQQTGWGRAPIAPVPVFAGTAYTIAANVSGMTTQRRWPLQPERHFPQTYGAIRIDAAVSTADLSPTAIPADVWLDRMFGQLDIGFVPGPADAQAPALTSPAVSGIGGHAATVTWETDEPATSVVEYTTGTTTQTAQDAALVTTHTVNLTGLSAFSEYAFTIRSADAAGNESSASGYTFTTLRPEAPSRVTINGRQLLVEPRLPDGTLGPAAPYIIRGVDWSPASRATNTSPTDPNNANVRRPEYGLWYQTDIPLMKAMNVNTVRLFLDPGVDATLGPLGLQILDELYKNDMMVIMTVDDAINNVSRAQQVVDYYKNHPAILMWSLGSEWNINRYFTAGVTVADAAQRTQNAAALVKLRDNQHPVASSYGEIDINADQMRLADTHHYVNNVCTSVDLWSFNLYRGQGFGEFFAQWQAMSGKPMFLGEYGVDAYDDIGQQLDEPAQALWDRSLWDEILQNLSARDPAKTALGGAVFAWSDEWWKVPPAGSQQTGYWDSWGFPDLRGNEEYFGLVNIDRQPRQVYSAMAEAFHPAYVAPPAQRFFTAASRGAAAAQWAGQYGFSRFFKYRINIFNLYGGAGGGRGFSVAAMNPTTGALLGPVQTFDTWSTRGLGTHMNAMISYLNGLPNGTLVMLAVADEAGINTDNSCNRFGYSWTQNGIATLEALGSTKIRQLCFRGSWAMVAVKGEGAARAEAVGQGIEARAEAGLPLP